MRNKPTQTRYYRNTKTGQYALLEGSPLAINDIEERQWKRQKMCTKRISKRQYRAAVPNAVLGYGYSYYPNVRRKGRSEIRKGNIFAGHKASFYYWPY